MKFSLTLSLSPTGGILAEEAIISAPAHLHVGNIDLNGEIGRLFGTLGFTILWPRHILHIKKCRDVEIKGRNTDLFSELVHRLKERYDLPGICININTTIPCHVGMGCTTAAVLSIIDAYRIIYNINIDTTEALLSLGRSHISALGYYSYSLGGAILDGGYRIDKKGKSIPPLIARYNIPSKWRFLIILPYKPLDVILKIKSREDRILSSMKKADRKQAEENSHIVLMKILPSLAEKDLHSLMESLVKFNENLGKTYWKTYQGGTYCCKIVEDGIKLLKEIGLRGGIQSSWGPTFYTITRAEEEARRASLIIGKWLKEVGGGEIYITPPDNKGARIIFVK